MTTLKVVKKGKLSEEAERRVVSSGRGVYNLMKFLEEEDRETFYVLHMDTKRRVIAQELISIGTLTSILIHPREVFKGAVLHGSESIICVHNHPSGDPMPSMEDNAVTLRLKKVGEILGIALLDHIIIGSKHRFYSFLEGSRILAAAATIGAAAETTGKTKGKLKVIKGTQSTTPKGSRAGNIEKLPRTCILLKSVKTFSQTDIETLESMLKNVWEDGDDDMRTILYGQVSRLYGRICLKKLNAHA